MPAILDAPLTPDAGAPSDPQGGPLTMLRTLTFHLWMTFVTLIIGIFGLPSLLLDQKNRTRVCQFWCRSVLWGLEFFGGIKTKIQGLENVTPGGMVIAANHQSMWETMQIYAILPQPVIVLKEELLRIPLFGLWLKASGCIAIDRESGSKAMRKLLNDASAKTAAGGQIIIFPEGTRRQPYSKTDLKPGIAGIYAATQVPCLPIAHNSGMHWQYPSHRIVPGIISMNIAEPISTGLNRKSFMTSLEEILTQLRPDALPFQPGTIDGTSHD